MKAHKWAVAVVCVALGLEAFGQRPDTRGAFARMRAAAVHRPLTHSAALVSGALTIGNLTTFDVLGADLGTNPFAINSSGRIAGYYCSSTLASCPGFLRRHHGQVTTFSITGATTIQPEAINSSGEVTGYACGTAGCVGFLRTPNGTTTVFVPVTGAVDTTPLGINSKGEIAGYFGDKNGFHGFVQTEPSQFATFDVTGGEGTTFATTINRHGKVAGDWVDSSGVGHGFLRSSSGNITTFDPLPPSPLTYGAPGDTITIAGINDRGEIAGYYCTTADGQCHGFVLDRDGTFTTFDPAGSINTLCSGIDDAGTATGAFADFAGSHVFLRGRDGTLYTIDVPGALGGYGPIAISSGDDGAAAITGSWFDGSGLSHGFVQSLREPEE